MPGMTPMLHQRFPLLPLLPLPRLRRCRFCRFLLPLAAAASRGPALPLRSLGLLPRMRHACSARSLLWNILKYQGFFKREISASKRIAQGGVGGAGRGGVNGGAGLTGAGLTESAQLKGLEKQKYTKQERPGREGGTSERAQLRPPSVAPLASKRMFSMCSRGASQPQTEQKELGLHLWQALGQENWFQSGTDSLLV
ncbi:unnamed protein product [Merluccius merluccius]